MAAAGPKLSKTARKERRRRIFYVAYRWFLVLVGSVGVGWLIHGALQRGNNNVPIELPTTGVAIAAACAFAGDLMALIAACGQFVRGESNLPGEMVSGFWKAWGTATTLFLALFSYVVPTNAVTAAPAALVAQAPDADVTSPSAPSSRPGEPWLIVYSTQAPPPAARPRLSTVPVFYRRDAMPEENGRSQGDNVPGISFARDELDVSMDGLRRIVTALAACGAVPDGPATELEVAGYAGSKESVDPANSLDAMESNLRGVRIANRRAHAAYCFVGSFTPVKLANAADWKGYADGAECAPDRVPTFAAGTAPLQLTVRRWAENETGWREMIAARRFVDRPPGVAQVAYTDADELNRRVDISVLAAGSCAATGGDTSSIGDAPMDAPPAAPPTKTALPGAADGSERVAQSGSGEAGAIATGG